MYVNTIKIYMWTATSSLVDFITTFLLLKVRETTINCLVACFVCMTIVTIIFIPNKVGRLKIILVGTFLGTILMFNTNKLNFKVTYLVFASILHDLQWEYWSKNYFSAPTWNLTMHLLLFSDVRNLGDLYDHFGGGGSGRDDGPARHQPWRHQHDCPNCRNRIFRKA